MSTAALIPVEEYLATTYRPDCDYVDGKVEERNLGEYEHATIQAEIVYWFRQHAAEWNIRVLPEQRLQVSATRFRVPDVMVLNRDQPVEKIFSTPPLLIVEILSPKDTIHSMRERVNDYLTMGVHHIWLLDPLTREAFRCTANGFEKAAELAITGTPLTLPLPEIFAALD
jgi:Uma2 family endonuclease